MARRCRGFSRHLIALCSAVCAAEHCSPENFEEKSGTTSSVVTTPMMPNKASAKKAAVSAVGRAQLAEATRVDIRDSDPDFTGASEMKVRDIGGLRWNG